MATSLGPEDEIEVLEQVEFSDDSDDDNVEYAAVQYDDDDDDDDCEPSTINVHQPSWCHFVLAVRPEDIRPAEEEGTRDVTDREW
mmetsp:Transcript_25213/g.52362  ORF Transcript_25213/g.52362 Transcript_25213/m.52362 type:complete len:85 (-) Transcript_25213:351-605(-)